MRNTDNSAGVANLPATVRWLVCDHLGTPRMVIDQAGSLSGVSRRDYLPFGEDLPAGVGGRAAQQGYVTVPIRQKFAGYERDDEIKLDYAQARYYASAQGRFTSTDPLALTVDRLADPQRINLYSYCRNNPHAFTDPNGEKITFANGDAKKQYEAYVKFLNDDREKYADELATVKRLENSNIEFHLSVGGQDFEGAEGNTKTDGLRVLIAISNVGGVNGETFSLNSRFAHELEHARQVDNGEIIFLKGDDGKWHPNPSVYDIGDEVNAWKAQLKTSTAADFWKIENGEVKPSLLRDFAAARTDDERAGVLARSSYPNRNPRRNSVYVYGGNDHKPGDLVRTQTSFGRVNRLARRPN